MVPSWTLGFVQEVPLQLLVVHSLPSSQLVQEEHPQSEVVPEQIGVPEQVPFWQVAVVQLSPSLQEPPLFTLVKPQVPDPEQVGAVQLLPSSGQEEQPLTVGAAELEE